MPTAEAAADLSAAPAPAAPAAKDARGQAFDEAAAASRQRAAVSIAAADSASGDSGTDGARRVGARRFTLRDGVWVDGRYRDGMRTVRVRPYSAAYFALLDRIPDLAEAFALGERVLVAGRRVALAVDAAGAESLSERELRAVEAGW